MHVPLDSIISEGKKWFDLKNIPTLSKKISPPHAVSTALPNSGICICKLQSNVTSVSLAQSGLPFYVTFEPIGNGLTIAFTDRLQSQTEFQSQQLTLTCCYTIKLWFVIYISRLLSQPVVCFINNFGFEKSQWALLSLSLWKHLAVPQPHCI